MHELIDLDDRRAILEEFAEPFVFPGGAMHEGIWNASALVSLDVRTAGPSAIFVAEDVQHASIGDLVTRSHDNRSYSIADRDPDGVAGFELLIFAEVAG